MSESGVNIPESTGLTFVRPLPRQSGSSSSPVSRQVARPTILQDERCRRLFPTSEEDSASLGPITGLEIGHFVIEERIGRGGMGAVFRAIDRRLDRVVALKVLSPELAHDSEAVQRFQNEARAAARLDHDSVARVFYIGEEENLHFIAFEFVTGTNVRNLIVQKGRLSPIDAVNYTLQVAEALRQTAAANVVHRDIKPSNIIISPSGRAKLVDLGLARQLMSEESQDLTVAGTTLGTFDYIAPEQAIDARNVDVRTDIYSLGCTLYHMLTGEPPYPKGTMFQKVMNHHSPVPPNAAAKNPQVTAQLAHVIQKMMASNPDERYASPDALIADLAQVAGSMGLRPTFPEATVWTVPLFQRRSETWSGTSTWLAVAIVLLLVVILVDRNWDTANSIAEMERDRLPQQETIPAIETPPPAEQTVVEKTPDQPDAQVDEQTVVNTSLAITSGTLDSIASSKIERTPTVAEMTPKVTTVPPSVIPIEVESPEFIVIPGSGGESVTFPTLAEALAAAPDKSSIEIDAKGRIEVQKKPLNIGDKRLKILAADDSRPVIRFDLREHLAQSTFTRQATAIQVVGGALDLYDMDIELVVDAESIADHWSILSMTSGSQFIARGVSMTLVNPQQLPASIFSFPTSKATEISAVMPDRMRAKPRTISLMESVCRGQGDFVQQTDLDPSRVDLEHVGLVLSGAFARLDGSNAQSNTMSFDDSIAFEMKLNQVTMVTHESMLQMTGGSHGEVPSVSVDLRNSIIRVDQPDRPLVTISGEEDYDVLIDKLNWEDSGEPNFVHLSGAFCEVDSPLAIFNDVRTISLQEFGLVETNRVDENLLTLSSLPDQQMLHLTQPSDLVLRQPDDHTNPASRATRERRDAGADLSLDRFPLTLPEVTSLR